MFLGGPLSKFDRRCVLMLETWLRRFEVDRKCRLASRPVFLLDQIFLLFSWREQQQNTTFTKLSLFTPNKFYRIIKFISWVQFDISLRVILHQLWKYCIIHTRSRLQDTVFWLVSVTPYLPQEASDTKLLLFRPTLKFIFILVCKKEILKLWTRSK